MATPKPGEIRCPTCHRSTPPAAFCTQCGSAIPSDARIRPRGMDRDELQDRIRARRVGGEPFHRGAPAEEQPGYERFVPDETDARARRSATPHEVRQDYFEEQAAAEESGWPAEDQPPLTRDRDEWARPAAAVTSAATAPPPGDIAPPPSDVPMEEPEPAYVDNFDDEAYADDEYYDTWEEPEPRGSGGNVFAILGFLALGVLALGAGAVLAGIFGAAGVGEAPTPSPSPSLAPTVAVTPSASAAPTESAAPSGSPAASNGTITFPDGFTAEVQPCLPGTARSERGCDSNGSVNNGAVEIWVGFQKGTSQDVIGAKLIAPDGTTSDGSIDLASINCGAVCQGYTWFNFANLKPGTYEIQVTRNGDLAATTSFEVS